MAKKDAGYASPPCFMHELDPDTYPTADSWRESAMKRADITPGDLAKRGII